MTRPSDISQDVWDAAVEPAKGVYNDAFLWDDNGNGMYIDSVITTTIIARAIFAERERAATACEAQAAAGDDTDLDLAEALRALAAKIEQRKAALK